MHYAIRRKKDETNDIAKRAQYKEYPHIDSTCSAKTTTTTASRTAGQHSGPSPTSTYMYSEEEVRGRRKMKHKFIVEEVKPSPFLIDFEELDECEPE